MRTVARQGKDVGGLYPGQLGRVHVARTSKASTCLYPASEHEPDVRYAHDFDLLTLARSVHSQTDIQAATNSMKTTYEEAFSLAIYNTDTSNTKYIPVTHKEPLKKI
ncbi:protein SPMIP3 [Ascaphus truei]|uniref:protein SPMIP3 n=1 Tax=Ascaphus truei TaxID=8439 RepID=UPI003F5913B6